jgi:cell division protein FtsX
VIVINETMQQKFWPGGNALEQSLVLGEDSYEVVGVARDTKYRSLREGARNVMYLPYLQSHEMTANLLVRTTLPTDRVIGELRRVVREIDGAMPLYNVRTMAEHVNRSLYLDHLRAELIGYLAALALTLAAIGIYGVISYTVAERTREVGIRVALGAQPGAVLRMVLGSGMRLAAAGLAGGLLLSFWLTRKISSDLFGVTATDPVTLAGACGVLLLVAVIATLLPARRATRIDPILALRSE